MCVLGAPDTDYPLDADCVVGAYFPRRKARREVPPPPSNYITFVEHRVFGAGVLGAWEK